MGLLTKIKNLFINECEECVKLLELILDEEASQKDKDFFEAHIDGCKSCREHYNLELSIRKLIKEKIGVQPVPSDLVSSIKTQVRNHL